MIEALGRSVSQAEFAKIIGVSEAKVSQMAADGQLARGDSAHTWLLSYCDRLREVAAGRASVDGGLDLVQERAALARSQREAQELKNAVSRGEYAPVGLLTAVLGQAASAVVDRLEHLDGALVRACPDLPDDARAVISQVILSARNEWVRATQRLVIEDLMPPEDDRSDADVPGGHGSSPAGPDTGANRARDSASESGGNWLNPWLTSSAG